MAASVAQGFYIDPITQKIFFVQKVGKLLLIPPWVKSNPSDWKVIKIEDETPNKSKKN